MTNFLKESIPLAAALLMSGVTCVFAADGAAPAVPTFAKMVVVGDSITKHGPTPSINWSGNWGMAASSEEQDYVHLIQARLAAAQQGKAPQLMVVGGGGGKLGDKVGLLPGVTAFGADLGIVQMGENDNQDITADGFQKAYERIIQAILAGNPKARVFCFGVWTPPNGSATKDAFIQAACRDTGATFVSLEEANADPQNRAGAEHRFTHPGVNWHPGDKGMQAYADAFWTALTGQAPPPMPAASAPAVAASDALFTETWNGASGLDWNPAPSVKSVDGKSVLEVTLTEPNGRSFLDANLPVDKIKGRTLEIETRVKGQDISPKPNKWNGIRVGLKLQNAEGQINYPQLHLQDGTFDWSDAKWTFDVPDNVVAAQVVLGLENVTGTVDFDSVRISVQH
ncbi:MAG: SGNH/GDSL hydrolase family protein [Verrucomicrobiota bacterium]